MTGGNRGIGFGFAEALYEAGAAVAIWGSNEKKNHEAVERLGSGLTVPLQVRPDGATLPITLPPLAAYLFELE